MAHKTPTELPQHKSYVPPDDPTLITSVPRGAIHIQTIHKHPWQSFFLITFLLVTGAIIGQAIQKATSDDAKAAAITATVSIQPSTSSLPPSKAYQVWIKADSAVAFVRTDITFDPAIIKLTKDPIIDATAFDRILVKTPYAEANASGIIHLTVALSPANRTTSLSGTFQLTTLNFTANSTASDVNTVITIPISTAQIVSLDALPFTVITNSTRVTLNPSSITTGTPSPTPSRSSSDFTLSNVHASRITSSTATINWNLSDYGTGQVEYGTTTNYGLSSAPETSFDWNYHIQTIKNLNAGTLYHYRVKSTNRNGVDTLSGDYTFTTLPSGGTSAQGEHGIVSGSVLNRNNKPVSGATIILYRESGRKHTEVTRTKSLTSGAFSLSVPYGTYRVTCQARGYRQQSQTVTIGSASAGITFYLGHTRWFDFADFFHNFYR